MSGRILGNAVMLKLCAEFHTQGNMEAAAGVLIAHSLNIPCGLNKPHFFLLGFRLSQTSHSQSQLQSCVIT